MRQWLLLRAQRVPFLRVIAEVAENLFAPRQAVGVLALIVNADGHILVAHHATRPHEPWGLPGGWVASRELPEDAVLREVEEELGIPVTFAGYAGSHPHDYGRLRPRGLTFVYRLDSPLSSEDVVRPRTWEVVRTRWVAADEACAMLHPFTAERVREALQQPRPSLAGLT